MFDSNKMRQQIRERRRMLSGDLRHKASKRICSLLETYLEDAWRQEEGELDLLFYAPMEEEVDLWPLLERLWQKNWILYLPRVEERQIRFYPVRAIEELRPGKWGILEPKGAKAWSMREKREQDHRAISICPGLLFDCFGSRIGYGGGYYDRFFAAYPKVLRLAVAFDFQVQDERLPQEPWDQKMDLLLSERGFLTLDNKC